MTPLLTATQLAQWADERPSQEMLPMLVRRLIVAATNPIRIDFPAGASVNRPGYDGFLQTVEGNAFVPAGQSVWEMGTGENPAKKADADYAARTAKPGIATPAETTFVFVTPRRWNGKKEWAATKKSEGIWADVRAYDGDDLEQWFDQTPPVAAWARRRIVGTPDGLSDIEEIWEISSQRTNPSLSPELFMAGRDEACDRIKGWLTGPAACLRVRADTVEEVLGFVAGLVEALPEPERERVRSRALLTMTPDAWRFVAGQRTRVILITTSPSLGSDAQAIAHGHHVLLAYGNDDAGVTADVDLPPLRRTPMENALMAMGLSRDRARDVGGESRGRIKVIVDLLGGDKIRPRWAAPETAPELVPFLLAGTWSASQGDNEAMMRLTRLPEGELSHRVSRWVNDTDSPLRLVAGHWEWVSRIRAWPHISRYITAPDLAVFQEVVMKVVGEVDPRLELPAGDRWMAGIRNCEPRYSEPLKKGLAAGLALLATRSSGIRQAGDPISFVNSVVRDLFDTAPNPRRWYSFAPVLCTLAEAAPEQFLAAVERDVIEDLAVRAALFEEEGMFGSSRHTELLWALETLAWSPEYLSRVAVILAGLTTVDPGGHLANRPHASLRTIFLPWKPYTMASVDQRLAGIDAIHRQYPKVAFDLCIGLMPHGHDAATPTPVPHWRQWKVDRESQVLPDDYWKAVGGSFDRALSWAGEDQVCWQQLLTPLPQVPPDWITRLLLRIKELPLTSFAERPDDQLRRAIRRILHVKRTNEDALTGISQAHVETLEWIYVMLEPQDPVKRDAWLFDNHPDLLTVSGDDWRAEEQARESERASVIRRILRECGSKAILQLAESVEAPWAVGFHVGQADEAASDIAALLTTCVNSGMDSHLACFQGIVNGRFRSGGWEWVQSIFSTEPLKGWSVTGKARFGLALPFETSTWDWVEAQGEEVTAEYWKMTRSHWVTDAARDAARAIQTFLVRGRPFAALQITTLCLHGEKDRAVLTPDLLLAVLRAVTSAATGELETAETPRKGDGMGHALGELLSAVEQAGVATEAELARIEWIWFPVLNHSVHGVKTLHKCLASDPKFFAEVISLLFRPRRDDDAPPPPPPDEVTKRRAQLAWQLLSNWRGVPGRTEQGSIDEGLFREWVVYARHLLQASGHSEVGDHQIGEVLARVPPGADGVWPHECLRNLLEELRADELDKGVYFGIMNGRGITSRSLDTGGGPELSLAEKFESWSRALLSSAPRIAIVLRQVATSYRAHARREDDRRDLNEFWL